MMNEIISWFSTCCPPGGPVRMDHHNANYNKIINTGHVASTLEILQNYGLHSFDLIRIDFALLSTHKPIIFLDTNIYFDFKCSNKMFRQYFHQNFKCDTKLFVKCAE